MRKILVAIVGIVLNSKVLALSLTNIGEITEINSYTDYGSGDVLIYFDTGLNACPSGGYISPSMPGYQTALSIALTGYTAQRNVRMEVFTSNLWSGSSSKQFCAIRRIDLK
ncbi:hypothetical protein ACJJH9_11700 [Microbulbifer sp. DLAB2-AF]|uniref:hypothetical protein n=1 Tax=Microbulbifer sp. DLAB2-AF TaxID=3243395 RepID=UPI004039910D